MTNDERTAAATATAQSTIGLGARSDTALTAEVQPPIRTDVPFIDPQPALAGALATMPGASARVLRKCCRAGCGSVRCWAPARCTRTR